MYDVTNCSSCSFLLHSVLQVSYLRGQLYSVKWFSSHCSDQKMVFWLKQRNKVSFLVAPAPPLKRARADIGGRAADLQDWLHCSLKCATWDTEAALGPDMETDQSGNTWRSSDATKKGQMKIQEMVQDLLKFECLAG